MMFPDGWLPPSGVRPDTPNYDLLLLPCRLDLKYYVREDHGKGDERWQQQHWKALAPQIQPPEIHRPSSSPAPSAFASSTASSKIRQPSPSPAPSAFASSTASSTSDAPSPFSSFGHDSSTSVDDDSQSRPSSDSEERELRDEHFQTTTPDGWQAEDPETAVWSDAEGEHDSSDDDIPIIESLAHGTRIDTRPTIPLPARHTSSALSSGNLTTPPRVSGPLSSGGLSCDTSSYIDETDSQPDDDSDYEDTRSATLKRPRASYSAPKRQRTNANTALPRGQNKGKARATAKPATRASEQQYSQDDDGQWHLARNTSSVLPSGNLTTPPRVSGPSSSRVSGDTFSDAYETDSQPDDDSDYEDVDARSTLKRSRASSSAPKRQRTNANTALPSGQNKGKARATAKPAPRASEQRYRQDDDGQWHCLYPGCEANLKATENGVRRHWNSDHGPHGTCPACGKQFKNTRKDLLRKHLDNSCPKMGTAEWKAATEKMNDELVKRRRRS